MFPIGSLLPITLSLPLVQPSDCLHAQLPSFEPLAPNTSYETDGNGWAGVNTGGCWEQEEGNRFLRLAGMEPGKMVMQHQEIHIPEGAGALHISWLQRITDLRAGTKPWFDARIMFGFLNAARKEVKLDPAATSRDTGGWVERRAGKPFPPPARHR